MAQTLKFGKGVWATKTGSSMAYNDQSGNYKPLPFNVERDSIATRVNKQGLIEVVGKDKLRIDYTDSAKGVALLEPSRTNFDSDSENFDTSFMSNSNGIQSSTLVSDVAPDGTTNSVYKISKVTDNSDPYIGRSGVSFTNTSMTFSVWLWTDEDQPKDVLLLIYRDSVSEITTKNITLTTTPTRYFIQKTFSNTPSNISYRIDLTPNSSNQYIYAWGKQVEEGNYATSYIPTSGSTYQRQADVVNGSGNSEVFNDSEGVLFANIAANADDGSLRTITLGDGSSSNAVSFRYDNPNQITLYLNSGGASQCSFAASVPTLLFNKCLIKYKANDFSAWVNGFEIGVDSSGITFPSGTLDRINFDIGYTSTNPFYGSTKEIGYYDATLTDAELETLTSYRSLNELVTELNLNTL